jgi:hypothetical protein
VWLLAFWGGSCYTCDIMADCNIRDIGDDFFKNMKIAAAQDGLSLKDWCCRAFAAYLTRGLTPLAEPKKESVPLPQRPKIAAAWPAHAINCDCSICKPPKASL